MPAPEVATDPSTGVATRQPPYMVRAITRGWYPDPPGRHFGMADKHGWSIRQRVREPGEVFQIKHPGHFSAPSDGESGAQAIFGWMEWADAAPTIQREAPVTTVTNRVQDPLSIGREAVMVDRPGEPGAQRGAWPGSVPTTSQPQSTQDQARQSAERMATSGVKTPAQPQVPTKGK